jgi:hypothetical protein
LPYKQLAPVAQIIKAFLQMIIGSVAVFVILSHIWAARGQPIDVAETQEMIFSRIGLALGLAAAIELAYTLFTHGPDEALDPLMLGVAAALLLQLGKVEEFDYREGIATLLYVASLAGLFAVRKKLASEVHVGGFHEWWASWKFWKSGKPAADERDTDPLPVDGAQAVPRQDE